MAHAPITYEAISKKLEITYEAISEELEEIEIKQKLIKPKKYEKFLEKIKQIEIIAVNFNDKYKDNLIKNIYKIYVQKMNNISEDSIKVFLKDNKSMISEETSKFFENININNLLDIFIQENIKESIVLIDSFNGPPS